MQWRARAWQQPAWRRGLLGLAFAAVSGAAVAVAERCERAALPPSPALPATASGAGTLHIESSYPVQRWRVSVLGEPQAVRTSSLWHWEGVVSGARGEMVLVVAEAAPEAAAPGRALRLRWQQGEERVVWGEGDITVALPLP
ncbi:MAG: hypothetical protein NZ552_03150 [Planctomycetes bacterium]|nr:hypothetical protein [Planctomycetota bacterium]